MSSQTHRITSDQTAYTACRSAASCFSSSIGRSVKLWLVALFICTTLLALSGQGMTPAPLGQIAMSRNKNNQVTTSSNSVSALSGGQTPERNNNDPIETEITKPITEQENSSMTPILEMEIVPNERTSTQVALHVVPEQEGIPCPSGFVLVRRDEGVDVKNSTGLLLVHHRKPQAQLPAFGLPEILNAISEFLSRFMVFSNQAHPPLIALWIAHTWVKDAFEYTPYLHIKSPEKRCGKTRLIECTSLLSKDPWVVVSLTVPVLIRKIEQDCPTIFLDEVDTIFSRSKGGGNESLRGILNVGFQRHAKVARCEGTKRELHNFSVFCPKVLGGIGSLPDTIADRCIPIRLERRERAEQLERFKSRDVGTTVTPLIQALENWSSEPTVIAALRATRPIIPEALGDRQADICEPLLAIADMAAGEWPVTARSAILSVCTKENAGGDSLGVRLLSDIRRVFGNRSQIATGELLQGLAGLDTDAPWAQWRPEGGQRNVLAAAAKVARMLSPYAIASQTIRIGEKTIKGYRREGFEEAWNRYCLPVGTETVTP